MALILTETDVRRVLDWDAAIDAAEVAVRQYSTGAAHQPLRTSLEFGPGAAYLGVMPSTLSDPPAVGAKLVTVAPANAAIGRPSHFATIVLLDPTTGELLSVMDGRYITEVRTAAVSAISARYLAPPRVNLLAILGSGVQARSHLEALVRVRTIPEVQVWSPTPTHRARFAAEMAPKVGVPIRAVDSPEAAVREADLVALTTAATTPIVRGRWIKDGTHVMAVGAYRPDHREMDSDLVARSRVFVDSRAGALAEAGDILIPIGEGRFDASHIVAELGAVVAGLAHGRTSARQVTVFKSLGMAVEDVATAVATYRAALDAGVGMSISLS